jgi:hypothetical protein
MGVLAAFVACCAQVEEKAWMLAADIVKHAGLLIGLNVADMTPPPPEAVVAVASPSAVNSVDEGGDDAPEEDNSADAQRGQPVVSAPTALAAALSVGDNAAMHAYFAVEDLTRLPGVRMRARGLVHETVPASAAANEEQDRDGGVMSRTTYSTADTLVSDERERNAMQASVASPAPAAAAALIVVVAEPDVKVPDIEYATTAMQEHQSVDAMAPAAQAVSSLARLPPHLRRRQGPLVAPAAAAASSATATAAVVPPPLPALLLSPTKTAAHVEDTDRDAYISSVLRAAASGGGSDLA